jgi:hypothetical protein
MKTKLLALVLLAGGSVFAQTRFSSGENTQGFDRGYRVQTSVTARSPQRDDNRRYENDDARRGDNRSDRAFSVGFDRDDSRSHVQNWRWDDRDGDRFRGR